MSGGQERTSYSFSFIVAVDQNMCGRITNWFCKNYNALLCMGCPNKRARFNFVINFVIIFSQ
jgi:hypothetical protein